MSRDYRLFLEDILESSEKILWDIVNNEIPPLLGKIKKILLSSS